MGTNNKKFVIHLPSHVGMYLGDHRPVGKLRPSTTDVMASLFAGFEIRPIQVVINKVEMENMFYSRLFLEQITNGVKKILEIDARPSDSLPIAIEKNLPIFCTRNVLENTMGI